MLRDIIVNAGINVDATYTAAADMKTGMGVVKDSATGKVSFPSAATGENVVFIQKDKIPTGANAARKNFSDYEEEFNTVKAGDKVVCYAYPNDNDFATDQFDATSLVSSAAKKAVVVGTDGKLTLATSTAKSRYQFIGLITDNGHTLARIHVLDTPIANS